MKNPKKSITIDPYRYNNKTSIDGTPLKKGEVLVPIWLQDGYRIPAELKANIETWRYGEFKFHIGFMPLPIGDYESYMKDFFNKEINNYLAERREGRCVIGRRPNGEPILCPKSRRCTGCFEKNTHERYNQKRDRYQTLSLDYCYENEDFDYEDENAVNPEDYVISQEAETFDEVKTEALKHLEEKDARYAHVIKLELDGKTIDEICIAIELHSSQGRAVINKANDKLCDHLKMRHMKTKRRKQNK